MKVVPKETTQVHIVQPQLSTTLVNLSCLGERSTEETEGTESMSTEARGTRRTTRE